MTLSPNEGEFVFHNVIWSFRLHYFKFKFVVMKLQSIKSAILLAIRVLSIFKILIKIF